MDISPEDAAQVERIRSKLTGVLSADPNHADKDQIMRILAKLPGSVDMGPSARRAQAGMAPGPNPQAAEAESGAGGPEYGRSDIQRLTDQPGPRFEPDPAHPNQMRRRVDPNDPVANDPLAQEIVKNAMLMGVTGLASGAVGLGARGIAATRGAKLREIVDEASAATPDVVPGQYPPALVRAWGGTPKPPAGIPDTAAEQAAEELKFRLIPPHLTPDMTATSAAIDLARRNAAALSGALSKPAAVAGRVAASDLTVPPATLAARRLLDRRAP